MERAWTGQAGEEEARGDPTKVYIYVMGENKEERTRLALLVPNDRTRGGGQNSST